MPAAIQEAVQAHFRGEPEAVRPPIPLEVLTADLQYQGGVWLLMERATSRIRPTL
ncbi:hypothetical protein [Rhodoferax ferrireducens]|uniref:hypothetical protein n=1 Tax=Rhodoferax ferrireducens TaxID=192843 RepID=UPI003C7E2EAA